jgi:hypothetical protein
MFNFYRFLRKKWAEISAAAGQQGTVVDDLAVKPTGVILGDFYNTLSSQRRIANISNWRTMTEEELNVSANKYFIPRIEGGTASVSIRIYFDEKKDVVLTDDFRAVSTDSLEFKVLQPTTITRNSFKDSTDSFALYQVDVQVQAVSPGDEYQIKAGEITQLNGIDFTYKAVTNPEDAVGGSKHETNEEYFNRLMLSVNDRSMMNKKSVFALLPNFFPSISSIYIAGSGDKYMQRDLVTAVDLSQPLQEADFRGKLQGENIVKHIAFQEVFPPNPGSFQSDTYWGPHSSFSDYRYHLTIEPATDTFDPDSPSAIQSDAAFYGYQTDQEATDDQYKGLYFNDYNRFIDIQTNDLYNIDNENLGINRVVVPDETWIYGANGHQSGDFGTLESNVAGIDVLNFQTDTITFGGGASSTIVASKDILKRTGVKLTGTFTWPEFTNEGVTGSVMQFMVGGVNSNIADAYTGIGFGVLVNEDLDPDVGNANTTVFFAHSEQYGTAQVFASNDDVLDHVSITNLGALAEKPWRLQAGIEYEYEFIIYDDLRVSLFFNKTSQRNILDTDNTLENELRFELPSKILNVFSDKNRGGILAIDSTRYGTMMKVSLETDSVDPATEWTTSEIKAFDMNPAYATTMYSFNMDDIEDPIKISLRAFGQGSLNGSEGQGYQAFIWDKEIETIASSDTSELTQGGWSELSGITNPEGTKNSITGLLTHELNSIDRYLTNSRFGNSIFIMLVASGPSKASVKFYDDIQDDIHSMMRTDYIKVESLSVNQYHANNKTDFYLSTIKNSEEYEATSTTLTKEVGDTFFELNAANGAKMPVFEILSVTVGGTVNEAQALADTDYTVVQDNSLLANSAKETFRIILNNIDADEITVEYVTYPDIENVQNFYDSSVNEKIFGDILVKHKFETSLSFSLQYTGNITDDQLVDEVRRYVDDNVDGTFSVNNMITHLLTEGFVNNVREPVEVSYEKLNDDFELETGTFTDSLTIRAIDFFRIKDLEVNKIA